LAIQTIRLELVELKELGGGLIIINESTKVVAGLQQSTTMRDVPGLQKFKSLGTSGGKFNESILLYSPGGEHMAEQFWIAAINRLNPINAFVASRSFQPGRQDS